MSKRVTIILDDDIMKKLRIVQAKLIRDSEVSVSFSKVINLTLSKYFK
jgi:hypothetical protein